MKVGFYSAYMELNDGDFIFKNNNSEIGDDLLLPFSSLLKSGQSENILFEVVKGSIDNYDCFLLFDLPRKKTKIHNEILSSEKKVYLLLLESKHVLPNGYKKENHERFTKIFTWDDDLVDGEKYFKINYSYSLRDVQFEKDINKRNKKLVLISGNKKSNDEFELYSEREKLIRYFDKQAEGFLDLYGVKWDERAFSSRLMNYISYKFGLFRKLFYAPPICYKGKVARKRNVLKEYIFCLCFENRHGDNGYITEKIFDSMFAYTIPVYYGASNISEHIPEDCYIDYRKFRDIDELFQFIIGLSDSELQNYCINISKFLHGPKFKQFTIETFTKTIIENMKESYQG
ncbi:glycosyltransferase family 10 domain-containing protein [Vibrio aestuarianus]|uniref:glycosyltransferase family 10 domain-containing protein n=1 Tax=Vibrio aestuarianus TaxID=28171 RepID=UPI0024689474|nr:glycosyltransferase family 10 [Vibrio aestuarianus]MDH5970848.1 glycosyltransferase family 10 [Vibrio aestuarianus]